MALDKCVEQRLERLTTDEFRKFIPDLKLEELFLTQFRIGSQWRDLFTIKDKKAQIECNPCKILFELDAFKIHINSEAHGKALDIVEQFYHSFYTYSKEAEKLASGESVPEEELQLEIAKANSAFSTKEGCKFAVAKDMAKRIELLETLPLPNDLQNLVLQTPSEKPEDIFAVVCLSIKELLLVEFALKPKEWQKMLSTEQPLPNGKYFCALCEKFCAGIITVDAHLRGYTHKKLQLATSGVRLRSRPYLTKNCVYQSGIEYSLKVSEKGVLHFQEELDELSRSNNKRKTENSNQNSNGDQNGKTFSAEAAVELESTGLECNEKGDKLQPENSTNSISNPSETSELTEDIKKKAKQLASNIPSVLGVHIPKDLVADEEGLIGVEYVVKIKQHPTMFECFLCHTVLKQQSMAEHLIRYDHRLKYCKQHYPDTLKKFKSELSDLEENEMNDVMGIILTKLAHAIENHHGRCPPLSISPSSLEKHRREIRHMLNDLPHASQLHGPSFSNILSPEDIQSLKVSKQTYKPPRISRNQVTRFETGKEKSYIGKKATAALQLLFDRNQFSKRTSPSRSPQRERKRPRREYEGKPDNVWEEYHKELLDSTAKIERLYNKYRKNPESHPLYDEEWNGFWARRKKELIALGMDYRSYNYQPEWVYYFKSRLEELYTEELSNSKRSIRKRLNLSTDREEKHTKKTSISNFDSEFYPEKNMEQHLKSTPSRQSNNHYPEMHQLQSAMIEDEKPNIIHVLRLLTALEDYLGSSGVKIMELLSLTLVQEKLCANKPGELEKRILSSNNCTLLETVMEKLKGIVFAGLVDGKKLQSFNRVIQCTSNLLDHANQMGWREKHTLNETNSFPNIITGTNRSDAANDFNKPAFANSYGDNQHFKFIRNVNQPNLNETNNRNSMGWGISPSIPLNNPYGSGASGLNAMGNNGNSNLNILDRNSQNTINIKPFGYNNTVGAGNPTQRIDYGNIQRFSNLANTSTMGLSIQSSSTVKSIPYGKGANSSWGRFQNNSQPSVQNNNNNNKAFYPQNFQQNRGNQ